MSAPGPAVQPPGLHDLDVPTPAAGDGARRGVHRGFVVAAVTFVTLLGAAGFRSVPGVMLDPLHQEFGWSHGTIGAAMSINMTLYGLMSPFAAALMERFGIRPVACAALVLVAAGAGSTVWMTAAWQLLLLWGLCVGVGTGSMSMALVAIVTGRWFVARRGLVSGVLTAAGATGQLIFLPLVAALTEHHGWRPASVTVALAALAVVPLVAVLLRDHPHDLGLRAYGATNAEPGPPPPTRSGNSAVLALTALRDAARVPAFWLLAGSFAICGATTNGLIGTHFIPAAHDHGMPATVAASLLALIGVFDVAGTIASGWLTDRVDPRLLLVGYYAGRGVSLLLLPSLLGPDTAPGTWVFILFYGLDWVATVPPTVALCREFFGARAPIVFGWVFASHQLGAALAASGAGLIRDLRGSYDLAFYVAAGLCAAAVLLCLSAVRPARPALPARGPA
ncbi:Sugar phosphate permease [Jatrophihabitans endophyticus]|uniref:Sugar phosphate permease n=1 Tax=Jatrophihabitans endophyticus TaxID=1206085 RepID=A0A1M5N3W1_9ACTN|nr:MFS transporter [Jatrophihabitans endophyticus]SHG83683.1 Sugar phosphate permease [Jatrophihabitans endophyticus]